MTVEVEEAILSVPCRKEMNETESMIVSVNSSNAHSNSSSTTVATTLPCASPSFLPWPFQYESSFGILPLCSQDEASDSGDVPSSRIRPLLQAHYAACFWQCPVLPMAAPHIWPVRVLVGARVCLDTHFILLQQQVRLAVPGDASESESAVKDPLFGSSTSTSPFVWWPLPTVRSVERLTVTLPCTLMVRFRHLNVWHAMHVYGATQELLRVLQETTVPEKGSAMPRTQQARLLADKYHAHLPNVVYDQCRLSYALPSDGSTHAANAALNAPRTVAPHLIGGGLGNAIHRRREKSEKEVSQQPRSTATTPRAAPHSRPQRPAPIPGDKRCQYCRTNVTPMWRRGPNGPGTLCNACGVKWKNGRIQVPLESESSTTSTATKPVPVAATVPDVLQVDPSADASVVVDNAHPDVDENTVTSVNAEVCLAAPLKKRKLPFSVE